jgi:hypothetical protein
MPMNPLVCVDPVVFLPHRHGFLRRFNTQANGVGSPAGAFIGVRLQSDMNLSSSPSKAGCEQTIRHDWRRWPARSCVLSVSSLA